VSQPQTDSADDTRSEPHQPDLMRINAQSGYEETAAPTDCGHHTRFTGTGMLKPTAPNGRRRAEEYKKQRIHPPQRADFPVTGCGDDRLNPSHLGRTRNRLMNADCFRQWQPENAEPIGHADTKVNRQRGRRNQPTIKSRSGDRALLREKAFDPGKRKSPGVGKRLHWVLLSLPFLS